MATNNMTNHVQHGDIVPFEKQLYHHYYEDKIGPLCGDTPLNQLDHQEDQEHQMEQEQLSALDFSLFPLESDCPNFDNIYENVAFDGEENSAPSSIMEEAESSDILKCIAESEDCSPDTLTEIEAIIENDFSFPTDGIIISSEPQDLKNVSSSLDNPKAPTTTSNQAAMIDKDVSIPDAPLGDSKNKLVSTPTSSTGSPTVLSNGKASDLSSPSVPSSPSTTLTDSLACDQPNGKEKKSIPADRFKPFQEDKWNLRFEELLAFIKEHGHAAVPHTYPKSPQLARWIKRQRRQYKLYQEGKKTTMTQERIEILNNVNFVWDSHDVAWQSKIEALKVYRKIYGDCNVPSNYVDKKLATWVKCQRRQYKLYWNGNTSAMSLERISELERAGFEWEVRINPNKDAKKEQPENHTLLQEAICEF